MDTIIACEMLKERNDEASVRKALHKLRKDLLTHKLKIEKL